MKQQVNGKDLSVKAMKPQLENSLTNQLDDTQMRLEQIEMKINNVLGDAKKIANKYSKRINKKLKKTNGYIKKNPYKSMFFAASAVTLFTLLFRNRK